MLSFFKLYLITVWQVVQFLHKITQFSEDVEVFPRLSPPLVTISTVKVVVGFAIALPTLRLLMPRNPLFMGCFCIKRVTLHLALATHRGC